MLAYAFQTDYAGSFCRVPGLPKYTEIDGVNRSYHGCTHNGKREDVTAELVAIETFQSPVSRAVLRSSMQCRNPAGRAVYWTIPSSSSEAVWVTAVPPNRTCLYLLLAALRSPWPHRRRRPQW